MPSSKGHCSHKEERKLAACSNKHLKNTQLEASWSDAGQVSFHSTTSENICIIHWCSMVDTYTKIKQAAAQLRVGDWLVKCVH